MRPRARTARARPAVVSSTSRSSALTRRRCALSPRRAEQPVGATHEGSLRPRRRDGAHDGAATAAAPRRPLPARRTARSCIGAARSSVSPLKSRCQASFSDLHLLNVSRLLFVGHGMDAGHSSPLREGIAMKKISMSRFQIHDELTAPEGSVPVLRGALATGGQLPNFLGVLAGAPAALRAYARFRSELRHGTLTLPTLERIALAVAQHYHSEPGNQMHSRTARQAGLGLDEVALAKEWDSRDEREATLLRYLRSLVETQAQ